MKLKIAEDFSETPGARFRIDSDYSGEEFYEDVLKGLFERVLEDDDSLEIDFDGTYGYGSSFLEESFGRLGNEFDSKKVLEKLTFISREQENIIEKVKTYIKEGHLREKIHTRK